MRTGYKRETWEFGSSREVEEKHTGNYGARGQKREKKANKGRDHQTEPVEKRTGCSASDQMELYPE